MSAATTEVEAVAAWIDARLDVAFDERLGNDLRRLSLEAQSQSLAFPGLVQPAYAEMLAPLGDAIQRGMQDGLFHPMDPVSHAQFIHGVVWAGINQQWATGECDRDDHRQRIKRFCLRGLGVAPGVIEQVCLT